MMDHSDDESSSFEHRLVVPEPGPEFKSRYEVQEELGKGRFGVVHKVIDKSTNQKLAAKFIKCRTQKDKDKVQDEIDIMNLLRHQKLLQLAAAFEHPKEMVMVMEYISGGELFERVVADDFTLTEKDCILFMRQICEGVAYMHSQNIVHLDLKPENIMCHTRTSHEIKIIDFGLAQKIHPDVPVRVLFGTPEFIPPEIINYEPIGVQSDMWSLGVICYVLLSGLSPFMGDTDSETFANITRADYDFEDEAFNTVSQDARDFISALLVKRKEDRIPADQCLRHVWLDPDNHQETVVLSTDKLKKFIIRRKWQKTGNAIRALGRMATLSASRRNSANSNPTTPRTSISGTLMPRMGSVDEDKLIRKVESVNISRIITDSFDESDEQRQKETVCEEEEKQSETSNSVDPDTTDDILTQLPRSESRTKKEVRTRACSERSDSGISDCSTQTHMTSNSCNSTPLLGKKFPINEEGEYKEAHHYVSSTTINLRPFRDNFRGSSEESDVSKGSTESDLSTGGGGKKISGRLESKIESFNANVATVKNKPPQPSESLKRLPIYSSRTVQEVIKKFDSQRTEPEKITSPIILLTNSPDLIRKTYQSSPVQSKNLKNGKTPDSPKITIEKTSPTTRVSKIDRLVQKLEKSDQVDDKLFVTATPTVRYRSPSPSLLRKTQAVINKEKCNMQIHRVKPNLDHKNGDHLRSPKPRLRGNNEGFQKVAAFWNSPKT